MRKWRVTVVKVGNQRRHLILGLLDFCVRWGRGVSGI